MDVYRITLAKWANQLKASGVAARWNSSGNFIIYTAQSRSLACLENLVHRSGEVLKGDFSVLQIHVPDSIKIEKIADNKLSKNWKSVASYTETQKLGDGWIESNKSALLMVPSALVSGEYNYLLNPQHSDFSKIGIKHTFGFLFDERFQNL